MLQVLMPLKAGGLAFASHEGVPIVGVLFFDDKQTGVRYYAHAGSYKNARQLQANSPMVSFLIFDAKAAGHRSFDFYGVSPPDQPNHKWANVSKFKRSFGGYERAYSGTWELPLKRSHYTANKLLRKVTKA